MRLNTVAAVLAGVATMSVAHAQQPPGKAANQKQVEAYFLRNEVYFLSNGDANAIAAVTGDGIVLLDAMPAGWGAAVLNTLQVVSYMPVAAIINTHAHGDHAGANAEYPEPVQIVMHDNSRKRFAQSAGQGRTIKAFSDHIPVTLGNRPLHVYHFGKGHTDGDAIVVIPDIRAAYVGDLFAKKALPIVDLASGGSALALPDTLARAAKEITGVDHIVIGHGGWPEGNPDVAGLLRWPTWSEFREYAEFVRAFVDAVTASLKSGKTVERTAAELKLPAKYTDYRLDGAHAMIEAIFNELKQSPAAKR